MSITIDSTVAEKLQEVINTKEAIKQAIEEKGQSLDGVPFTEYDKKITAIQGGGPSDTAEFVNTYLSRALDREVELTIPNGIKYVGEKAINAWYKLNTTYGLRKLNTNEVETLEQFAFQENRNLLEIIAPHLTMLPYDVFYNCQSLKKVYFPNVLTAVKGNEFRACTSLEVAEFDKIENMTGYMFSGCTALTTLVIRTQKVCTLKSKFGNNVNFTNGTVSIYVPDDLENQYKGATNWVDFASLIKPLSQYKE